MSASRLLLMNETWRTDTDFPRLRKDLSGGSISCTPPHDRRQVYAEYHHQHCPRSVAPLLLGLVHNPEVGSKHIQMRTYSDLAYDRVYAITRRNKFIGLYLSSLVCARVITGLYLTSQVHIHSGFSVYSISSRAPYIRH